MEDKRIPLPTPADMTNERIGEQAQGQIDAYMRYEKLSEKQKQQLKKIKLINPENECDTYACSVELKNGEVLKNVVLMDVDKDILNGGLLNAFNLNEEPKYKLKDIINIFPSKNILPDKIAKKIYGFGETAMGGLHFYFLFNDGSKKLVITGSALSSRVFYELPEGYNLTDIVDVIAFDRFKDDRNQEYISSSETIRFGFRSSDKKPNSGNPFFEFS